jgi:hypothetical protein
MLEVYIHKRTSMDNKNEIRTAAREIFDAFQNDPEIFDSLGAELRLKNLGVEKMKPDDPRFNMVLRVFVINLAIPFFESSLAYLALEKDMTPENRDDHNDICNKKIQTIFSAGMTALEELYDGKTQTNPKILDIDEQFLNDIEQGLPQIMECTQKGEPAAFSITWVYNKIFSEERKFAIYSHASMHEMFLGRIGAVSLAKAYKVSSNILDDLYQDQILIDRLVKRYEQEGTIDILLDEFTKDSSDNYTATLFFMTEIIPKPFLTKQKKAEKLEKSFSASAVDNCSRLLINCFDRILEAGLKADDPLIAANVVKQEIAKVPLLKDAIIFMSRGIGLLVKHERGLQNKVFDLPSFNDLLNNFLSEETDFDFGAPDNQP